MKLSVIILNYNVRYFLELCLKSVQAAVKHIDAEIIVVDNQSKDDSCDMVKRTFPNVTLIENDQNYGFSKGNNIAVAQAKGEYICILNPDTVVAEDTFSKILAFVATKPNLGALGCKLINGTGDFLPESKRNIPYVKAAFKKILGNSNDYYANHLGQNDTGKIDVLVGAFMFLKRDVYNKVGGFDEDYFMYGEDIDLSYRLLRAGYDNYYYGETSVIHFKGESTLKNKFYVRRFYEAMQIFYKKHFKSNLVCDVFVYLGIGTAYLFRKPPQKSQKTVNKYVVLSKRDVFGLDEFLKKPCVLSSNLDHTALNDEVIFDAKTFSYKSIINFIENKPENKQLAFKILPKNSKFAVGSDDTINNGEVIDFSYFCEKKPVKSLVF